MTWGLVAAGFTIMAVSGTTGANGVAVMGTGTVGAAMAIISGLVVGARRRRSAGALLLGSAVLTPAGFAWALAVPVVLLATLLIVAPDRAHSPLPPSPVPAR